MAEDGRLPAIRVGRSWRFPADRIEALLDADHAEAARPSPPPRRPCPCGRRPALSVDPEPRRSRAARERAPPGHRTRALDTGAASAAVEVAADLLGVMMVVTDMDGRPVTDVANPCTWFAAHADAPDVLDACVTEWRDLADHPDFTPRFHEGALGFECARAFIRHGSTLVGMVLAGGVSPSTDVSVDPDLYHLDDDRAPSGPRRTAPDRCGDLHHLAARCGDHPGSASRGHHEGELMKRLLVLGAGTAGTMAVNKLRPQLPRDEWSITVVDSDDTHYYQPGYLFMPFGIYRPDEIVKPKKRFIPTGVDLVLGEIDRVVPEDNKVLLVDGTELGYDYLVIATGTTPRPEETPGMADDLGGSVHEFYTFEGATALAEKLRTWEGGRLVVHITEMPIKCPVAPLEFTFLADAFFTEQGMRDKVEIVYVTPLEGAFTKPVASKHLGDMLETRGIALEGDFMVESIDAEAKKLISFDEREVPYDLLVTIPLNMGADFIARSGLGDDLNYVPVDKQTLLSDDYDNIFVVGDASNIPASKAGSVAHFAMDLFPANFLRHIQGLKMTELFDGHANCFIETGHGKGLLIDFNYDTEPLTGKYPLPGVGPFSLLKETEMNHWGKVMFRWMYWNILLPGKELPLPALMSMAGKDTKDL